MARSDEAEGGPKGRWKNRTALMVMIAAFVAALIGAIAWGGFLVPTSKDGDLNSRPVDGSTGVKPKSF